jgi:hypothetical protein
MHRRSFGNILALETNARVLLAANSKLQGALQRGDIFGAKRPERPGI